MSYSQIQLPTLTKINKMIMITLIVVFILQSIIASTLSISTALIFGLSAKYVLSGFIFQFITYPFIGGGLIQVIFNALLFWFIGSELEARWGKSRYLLFLLSSAVGGGVIYFLLSISIFSTGEVFGIPLSGMSGVTGSLLLSYSILFPDRIFTFMLIFPMKAKYFCMLLIGILLYMGIFSPSGVQAWGHLGAMVSGVFYLAWITRSNAIQLLRNNTRRKKNHLRIIDNQDDEKGPPKYWH